MTKLWGSITWIFFHTISYRINNSYFLSHRLDILNIISKICGVLPCPYCREHANKYLAKNHFYHIRTKEQLISFLFNFHNNVNQRLHKTTESNSILNKYKTANIELIFKSFCNEYSKKRPHIPEYMNHMQRSLILKDVKYYFKNNGHHFINS
uniref:thiol oxidase n=1 Tax=viral metagenome TaxID=1070528 RepID=A0A6C0KE92_9ZZZZ